MITRILKFTHDFCMTYVEDGIHFGLFPNKAEFTRLTAEQGCDVMVQASALIEKIESAGKKYNERWFYPLYG